MANRKGGRPPARHPEPEPRSAQERKTPKAAALRYDPGQGAPEIVAAGSGEIAERIVATARQHGVPIREQPDLAAALVALGVGVQIPPSLYAAVAEVLAWVAAVDRERARKWQG
ncbi:MAG: EscU/YscU/HrcU family type III secretion system export apparatus switch protein [Firmicutes bacterium]|nr:EscU/YscU/HrcU family type III secretion system export apparatus switch protein [Bacillota bacterium]